MGVNRDICTPSSTRPCAPRTSSSTSLAPSRALAPSSATPCPRTPPGRCARQSPMPIKRAAAFAPGRVNLIGEHTDYNEGLALPFAIVQGVTVQAEAFSTGSPLGEVVEAYASDLDE